MTRRDDGDDSERRDERRVSGGEGPIAWGDGGGIRQEGGVGTRTGDEHLNKDDRQPRGGDGSAEDESRSVIAAAPREQRREAQDEDDGVGGFERAVDEVRHGAYESVVEGIGGDGQLQLAGNEFVHAPHAKHSVPRNC